MKPIRIVVQVNQTSLLQHYLFKNFTFKYAQVPLNHGTIVYQQRKNCVTASDE